MRRFILPLVLLMACDSEPELVPDPSPQSDEDNDGLTYQDEIAGWTLSINTTGYAQDTHTAHVVSDPNSADADGDGLTDDLERLYKSDPNRVDTDGDGLSDLDEAIRWGTNPAQADTDGDSRGSDPEFPAPPDRDLFDGGELLLEMVDGIQVSGLGATSPLLADTDGDGMSDYEELVLTQRDPVLAELPQIQITPTPFSALDLTLDVVYASGSGDTTSHSTDVSWGASTDWDRSQWKTMSGSTDVSVRVEASVTGEIGTKAAGSAEVDGRVTVRASGSVDWGLDSNRTTSTSMSAEFGRYHQRTTQEEHTVTGAQVQMLVDVQNTGTRTYLVEGLALVVFRWTGVSLEPVAYLQPAIPPFTLGPGEWASGLILRDDGANPQTVAALMRQPNRIVIGTTSLDLIDQSGDDFAYVQETVYERTSGISVELPDATIGVDIASSVERNEDGTAAGVHIGRVLDTADVGWEPIVATNPFSGNSETLLSIEGVAPEYHPTVPDPTLWEGLDEVGYTATTGPGARLIRGNWYFLIDRFDPAAEDEDQLLPIWDTAVYPGDAAQVVYAVDHDQDGLIAREEDLIGSSDDSIDSDYISFSRTDGLSDYWEAREGWDVTIEGQEPYHVYSSPNSIDGDGDGLWDNRELELGTDPMLADTDGDGFSDRGEATAEGLDLDPLRVDEGGQLTVTCENKAGEWGTYVVRIHSTMGTPSGNYISGEPSCFEDGFCHNNRARVEGGDELQIVIEASETYLEFESLAPARIDWRVTVPSAVASVGTLVSVEGICPPP